MKSNFNEILEFWRTEYSSKVKIYENYKSKNQLQLFANIFSPGNTYFYVINAHNLEIEFVSEGVQDVLGISAEDIDIEKILSTALPEEIESLKKKELIIKDFFFNFVDKDKITDYKAVYTYKMTNFKNECCTMLHQLTVTSVTENHIPMHVLSVHSKIEHIQKQSLPYVSFISLTGGPSYYNVSIEHEVFNPKRIKDTPTNLLSILTKREIEIVKQISNGLNANEIGNMLSISPHTVRTHKKNILCKTGVKNTAELMAKGYIEGLLT
ncbi:transcriptional regulator, LuxR family [Formosa agariphila KMM 3901]|uniref:Transcriptional regulator, LuxR family n=1 Tax=Formosa agariphila (strain DSM 15362 / KCTC 12365 / LMG 23005 / KMM 3901 / M-2Alg 35-1) TaxID=1347342 RepID=T2KJ48_FORAG|nr:LuxR C-terminal-related transcriptional regulator [Formosa agariphila]CDF78907.1 transcriptional regulator, LuxR family [Formosa agariphila KMM 3901]